jgi:hypothetical protein
MQLCLQSGVNKIFVTLDGPRFAEDQVETDACKHIVEKFNQEHPGILRIKTTQINQGAAHSVLGGLDWIFQYEDFAIVIEDDCLPSTDFFKFVRDARKFLDDDRNVFLIGGTQFVPSEITDDKWFYSDYPLIWGWATSREKWRVLRRELRQASTQGSKAFKPSEFVYWAAGARRAFQGFVDAWDTPLVYVLRMNGWKTILPGSNLVRNIGNDFAATHTLKQSKWIGLEALPYISSVLPPVVNPSANDWLKTNFYKISFRHQLTTRITRFLDYCSINRKKRPPLLERWL